jgi:nucleoside phosphorylase/CheY-like chemotaxis protein
MKIFILEDCDSKFEKVEEVIFRRKWLEKPVITRAANFMLAQRALERDVFDLLILDLMVPIRHGSDPEDLTQDISALRLDQDCKNRDTPAVALTQFEDKAEERIRGLNTLGITVITYAPGDEWPKAIERAIDQNEPPLHYDFVIVCALRKERDAYDSLGCEVGDEAIIDDLSCKTLNIGSFSGIVVVPTRMGLVSSAIACTKAIERFRPKLIAMSGICAGFDNTAEIYDVVVPERCYQHDSGKWTNDGFIVEPYQVALETSIRLKIDKLINKVGFNEELLRDIVFSDHESPEDRGFSKNLVKMAVSSSGSSVVASNSQSEDMKNYHRKGAAFEMESYAIYESAVSSCHKPIYFSAKSVVDNGNSAKGDSYHRVACLLSAKVCTAIVKDLLS